MNTEVITILDATGDFAGIGRAAGILRAGGLAALPTETVYGIAANALDPAAVAKIFMAKGRPQDNPLIVHVAELDEIPPLVLEFPETARKLAAAFWPGPLTVILPKSDKIPAITSANLDTVAIRMPSHPVFRAIVRSCGLPLAAPSANRSGKPSPTTAQHCIEDLTGRVDLIVDGGDCAVGLESTVVTLAENPPRLLRPGRITLAQLRDVLGDVQVDAAVAHRMPEHETPSSPGMKYRHYAPQTRLTLVHGGFDKFTRYLANKPGAAALVFDGEDTLLSIPCATYGAIGDADAQARQLFSALRKLDTLGCAHAFARAPDKDGLGLAVYNRLVRAAAFDEVYL